MSCENCTCDTAKKDSEVVYKIPFDPKSVTKSCLNCHFYQESSDECSLSNEQAITCHMKDLSFWEEKKESKPVGQILKKCGYTPSASDLLYDAAGLLKARGVNYDSGQERSMQRTVQGFNAITGYTLTEEQGWLFMSVLKLVRLQTSKGDAREDSVKDNVAYAALLAESVLKKEG